MAALYLLCAGQISATECFAGVIATLPALAFALRLHGAVDRPIRMETPWIPVIGAVAKALIVDTGCVGWVLLRGGAGGMLHQPFRHGGTAASDAGRRAVVTLGLSLAPNGYVARVDHDVILLHQLRPRGAHQDSEWPL